MFDVLEVSLEMIGALREPVRRLQSGDRDLARQVRRAASSVTLNIAEGQKRAGADRRHSWRVACGSADEVRVALRTAALSIPLNVAEGRGRTGKDRVHHWRIAHGSAEEVVAILRSAERLGDLAPRDCATAHATLTRLCQMLWRMTR